MTKVLAIASTKSSPLTVNLAQALLNEQAKGNISIDAQIAQLKLELVNVEKFLDPTPFESEIKREWGAITRHDPSSRYADSNGYVREEQYIDVKHDITKDTYLTKYGFGSAVKKQKEIINEINKLNLEKAAAGEFSIEQIREVAIKYSLRFLPANMYRGDLPAELPEKLREAEMNHKKRFAASSMDYNDLGRNVYIKSQDVCFILAPKESFQLEERPVDPLCFMRLDNDKFLLIHKWGNDLSILRKFRMFPNRSENHAGFIGLVGGILIATLSLGLPFWWKVTVDFWNSHPHIWWMSWLVSFFILLYYTLAGDDSKVQWNSPFKD